MISRLCPSKQDKEVENTPPFGTVLALEPRLGCVFVKLKISEMLFYRQAEVALGRKHGQKECQQMGKGSHRMASLELLEP